MVLKTPCHSKQVLNCIVRCQRGQPRGQAAKSLVCIWYLVYPLNLDMISWCYSIHDFMSEFIGNEM